eukprot:CFRG6527T1
MDSSSDCSLKRVRLSNSPSSKPSGQEDVHKESPLFVPLDILVLIIQHCDENEILQLRLANKEVNGLVQYHRKSWKFSKKVNGERVLKSISLVTPRLVSLTMRKCMSLQDNDLAYLSKLPQLKYLDLSGCRGLNALTTFPKDTAKNLESLKIDGCQLWREQERQPDEMDRFYNLVSLRIGGVAIYRGGVDLLKGLPALTSLDINIEGSENTICSLADCVRESYLETRLERLIIRHSALRNIPQWSFLARLQHLRELHFLDSISYDENIRGSMLSHVDQIQTLQQLSIHVFYRLSFQGTSFLPSSAANISRLSLSLLDSIDPILPYLPNFTSLTALRVIMFETMAPAALVVLKERIQMALSVSTDSCRVYVGSVVQEDEDDESDSDFSIADRSSEEEEE